MQRMARIFGFDPNRPEQYPLRWWAILLIVAVVARIISGFGVMIIGPFGWLDWPLIWIYGCRYVFKWSANRRRDKLFVQFPDALAMIVRSIRSICTTVKMPFTSRDRPLKNEDALDLRASASCQD